MTAETREVYNSMVIESIGIEVNRTRPEDPMRPAEAVRLLSAVADPVRWRLVAELAARGKQCVCDLQPVGGVAPNVLSYHLKVLRDAGLVDTSRRGRWIDYQLAPSALMQLRDALPGPLQPGDQP